jgi:hypothetical protein
MRSTDPSWPEPAERKTMPATHPDDSQRRKRNGVDEFAPELVDVLRGPEEWDHGPGWMRPIPMVALNDHQVALIYSLVLLALVQKTGSTADRHGQPRYSDVRHRWLVATAEELRRFGPGWRRCGARGSERSSSSGSVGWRGSRHRGVAGRGRAAARRAHGRACG